MAIRVRVLMRSQVHKMASMGEHLTKWQVQSHQVWAVQADLKEHQTKMHSCSSQRYELSAWIHTTTDQLGWAFATYTRQSLSTTNSNHEAKDSFTTSKLASTVTLWLSASQCPDQAPLLKHYRPKSAGSWIESTQITASFCRLKKLKEGKLKS